MRHIGIVACSAEGAALCYRTIALEGAAALGWHQHPEVSMHTFSLADYMTCVDAGDWDGVAALMVASAEKLASIGADFAVCPDNTIHQAYDTVAARSPIPWLHIADVVAAEAVRLGYQRLALTGTRYLMEGPVYPARLHARKLDYRIPDPDERAAINRIIFEELTYGVIKPESLEVFTRAITRLRDKVGCDAVILGCTEIPLLITPQNSPLPVLDSTRLLAKAAVVNAVVE
jgi:aspartate racemase